jgi:hypothetical protein
MLTGVSLFAGVGGFDLAMERNGVNVVANVEIDKHCQVLLERKFPNAKQFNDVTTVKGKDLIDVGFNPSRGIITGGFPCQDLSASLAKGLAWLANEAGYSGRLPELWKKRKQSGSYSKTSLVCYPVTKEKILESSSGRWQTSGILLPGGLLTLSTSEFPKDAAVSSSLADVLQGKEVQTKYYLSPKACEGILRRSSRRGKMLPPALQEALVNRVSQDIPKE